MMVSSFDQEAYKDDWIMIEFLPICVYGMPKNVKKEEVKISSYCNVLRNTMHKIHNVLKQSRKFST